MIPILYETNEQTFTSNGLGRLSDCLSCTVTEERNGRYDLEFTYPVTGLHFDDILEGRIIAVTHDEGGDVQPFVIYQSSKPLDGVVTFNAYHISYRLGQYDDARYTYSATATCQYLLTALQNRADLNNEPWLFQTDITGTYSEWGAPGGVRLQPRTIRECLGGADNSILSIFGGEYEFDTWTVNLWQNRGSNNGVSIRYGKNLTDFKAETDYSGAATIVYGYYKGDWTSGGTRQNGVISEVYDTGRTLYNGRKAVVIVDLSDKIENGDTKTQATIQTELQAAAAAYANTNKIWEPSVSIDVDFVQLWQTEEYKNYAPLLKCKLCDTVNVTFPFYGLSDLAIKIVSVEWDVLNERYKKMTLGGLATTLSQSINSSLSGSIQANADAISAVNSRTWVSDVTVNGTSVVTDGVAALPAMLAQATQRKTWSQVHAAATMGVYVEVTSFTIPAGHWVIMLANGNGLSGTVTCNINAYISSGTGTVYGGIGLSNDGSGNFAVGWGYIEATTSVTVKVRTYTYNTSVTNFTGYAVVTPVL